MRLSVSHTTSYYYDSPVDYGLQQVRLTPKESRGQSIADWDMRIEGGRKELEFTDSHANLVTLVSAERGTSRVVITINGVVETSDSTGVVGPHSGAMALWAFRRPTSLTKPGGKLRKLLKKMGQDHESELARAHALSSLILEQLPYEIGQTDAETTVEQALSANGGVCQDHAHIFITAMRELGHPARYVSGYLMMNDRDEQDATHGWAEAYFDDIGWVGFDISNGYSPDERYVRVATGFDYKDASPISGMRYGGREENMIVQLQVQQ